MTADGQFFIDDKPYKLEHSPAKVSSLLRLAGTSASEAVLVSEDGIEHNKPDESNRRRAKRPVPNQEARRSSKAG